MQQGMLLLIVLVFAVPLLLQLRRQKQQLAVVGALQAGLAPGKRVVSAGGLYGTVVSVSEKTVQLELAPQVVITIARTSIVREAEAESAAEV